MICRGLCECTEMLWMCVMYVSFGSKVRPRTFRCVDMGSARFVFLGPDCSYMTIRSQSTTSDDSCDRLNSTSFLNSSFVLLFLYYIRPF